MKPECLALSRAREIALSGEPTHNEVEHIDGCRKCRKLVMRLQRTLSHPPMHLFMLFVGGMLPTDHRHYNLISDHLLHCKRCRLNQEVH